MGDRHGNDPAMLLHTSGRTSYVRGFSCFSYQSLRMKNENITNMYLQKIENNTDIFHQKKEER